MKKFAYFIPVILVVLFSIVGSRLFASGAVSPTTLILITAVIFGVMLLARPKTAAPKPASDIEQKVLGEYAKDAFADQPQLAAKFQSAMKDYSGNMPKSALNKLQKLAPQCTGDKETYAVSMATALCQITVGKHKDAIREYVRALSLNPHSELAVSLGSCYQRLGELDKAKDTYQYALDLDGNNLEARSKLATAYVADGSYQMGLDQALTVLQKDEKDASALATSAICYGLLDEPVLYKRYTDLAVENGYKKDKITNTVDALKKRK